MRMLKFYNDTMVPFVGIGNMSLAGCSSISQTLPFFGKFILPRLMPLLFRLTNNRIFADYYSVPNGVFG